MEVVAVDEYRFLYLFPRSVIEDIGVFFVFLLAGIFLLDIYLICLYQRHQQRHRLSPTPFLYTGG